MKNKDTKPKQEVISCSPITGSKKIYVDGSIHPIRVAMRQIDLHPTQHANGKTEVNHPVTVYDTSGPYTDSNIKIDINEMESKSIS